MKLITTRMLLIISLILLVNHGNQSVLAATTGETESSVGSESTPSDEINEPEEDVMLALVNKMIVSDQLSIEPSRAHAGEQLVFNLTLPEGENFETIVLSYSSIETKAEITIVLTYDDEKKVYSGQFETNMETSIGPWMLTKAVGIDGNMVSNVLETRALASEEPLLKEGDFELIPHPAALFDFTSIKVVPNTVKVGEKLQFSLHSAKDVVLTNVRVVYRLLPIGGEESDQQVHLSLAFDEKTTAYEGEWSSITNESVGDWVVEYLSAVDEKGDLFLLHNRVSVALDKVKLQKQLDELQKDLLEVQTTEEVEKINFQVDIDLIEEKIDQLELKIKAKEMMLQADLSMGNFTIEEDLAAEETDVIDEELPVENEVESKISEKESSSTLLTESNVAVQKETAVATSESTDEQKEEDTDSMTSEKTFASETSSQMTGGQSNDDTSEVEEKNEATEATEFSKGSLFVVIIAFLILNGLIFKF